MHSKSGPARAVRVIAATAAFLVAVSFRSDAAPVFSAGFLSFDVSPDNSGTIGGRLNRDGFGGHRLDCGV
jgi:hypothetical protein